MIESVGQSTATLVAETLADHRLHASMNICTCHGWRATPMAGSLADQHEHHLAAAIAAALDGAA